MFQFRNLKPYQIGVDVSIAVACALFELVIGGFNLSLIALGGMATALALRRLSPGLALLLVWVTALIQVVFNIGPDPSNLAILPVLYATASYGNPAVKWWGLASTFAGSAVMTMYFIWTSLDFWNFFPSISALLHAIPQMFFLFVLSSGVFALSWTLGLLAKTWRASRESNLARISAENARIEAQKNVVVEQERNRIARDMHDVVAHSLAVVIAQADGARYVRESDPGAVDGALETISATAREALGDVRILLGQLRHSQTDAPQPVLADLDRLYEQMRSAGLALRMEETGTPVLLPGGVQLAVYRIVQEALTNALRHGNSTADSTVSFAWHTGSLHIDITNPVDPDALAGAERDEQASDASQDQGHGLAGMTERAALVGGSLDTALSGGKFVVSLTIPVAVPATLTEETA